MKNIMKIIFAVFLLTSLSGCYDAISGPDHKANFQWAINFCKGEEKISTFRTGVTTDWVACADGRIVDIPGKE